VIVTGACKSTEKLNPTNPRPLGREKGSGNLATSGGKASMGGKKPDPEGAPRWINLGVGENGKEKNREKTVRQERDWKKLI